MGNLSGKIFTALLVAIIISNVAIPTLSIENSNIAMASNQNQIRELTSLKVLVNGKQVNFNGATSVNKNGRNLVPLRSIFEAMGASVVWDGNAKTITAKKDQTEISLAINANVAYINGEEVILDSPSIIYEDRTLVPIRFIGEAFNGTVDWNGDTQTVSIEFNNGILEVPELKVSLNDNWLTFDNTPIFKDGAYYVQFDTILNGLTDQIEWERNGDEISILYNGVSYVFYINKENAIINGKETTITEYPIEYNGAIFAPARFVTEAFGGISHFESKENAIYLYINRPKFNTSFLEGEAAQIITPQNVTNVSYNGNRRLMVSDNPEILNENTVTADNVTLWQDEVNSWTVSTDHRIFGWHINRLGEKVKLGITIENLSPSTELEIIEPKGIYRTSPNGWSNYDVGLPIGEAVLNKQFINTKLEKTIIKPGETIVLQSFDLENDNLVGFLNELTIKNASGYGNMNYKIRTVLTQDDGDLRLINSDPVPVDKANSHPRGIWPSSELFTEFPAYTVGTGEVAYKISNGVTDNLMTVYSSYGQNFGVVQNTGHYGATYKVKIPIINPTGETKNVRVRVGARGGLYAGAIKTSSGVALIPVLEPFTEVANVLDYTVEGYSDSIELEIFHAGGSALPLAIDIITLDQ